MGKNLTEVFLLSFCEENSDGTRNLVLKGNDLVQRIGTRLDAYDMHKVSGFLSEHVEIISLNLSYNDIRDEGLEVLCDYCFKDPNKSLQYLNIQCCDVTVQGLRKLYAVREKMRALKTLRLNGNKLGMQFVQDVDVIVYVINMSERLSETLLSLFCETNSDGTKNLCLKGKDLWQRYGTRLESDDMHKISCFLIENPDVISVNLCYNNIGDEGLKILCDYCLSRQNSIQHLNVQSCDITANGIRDLFDVRETLNLETLRLTGNKLGVGSGPFLAYLVEECPTLRYLDVGDTDQTVESIEAIFLKVRFSQLTVLNVSRVVPQNCMYQYDPADIAETLGEFFRVNKHLVEFHGQNLGFDGHDVELILRGLKQNKTLRFLDLGYNNVGDFGVELISDWLKTRPNLFGLNVSGNCVRKNGALSLGFALPCSKIRFLDISYNKIDEEGMIHILNTIKKPYMLRIFYFWGNTLGHQANTIIARMILSTVLEQKNIDVKIYSVDDVLYAARYPADRYKHNYYSVMDYGCPVEMKIKRNKVEDEYSQPKALVKFEHIDRYPPVDWEQTYKKPYVNECSCECVCEERLKSADKKDPP